MLDKKGYTFSKEEENFFRGLAKQPYYSKAIEQLQQGTWLDLADIIWKITTSGKINLEDIYTLRGDKNELNNSAFNNNLGEYEDYLKSISDTISLLFIEKLREIDKKIWVILPWVKKVALNDAQTTKQRDLTVYWNNFLKDLEKIDWLISKDEMFFRDEDYITIEKSFMKHFKCDTLPQLRKKLNDLELASAIIQSKQTVIPWKEIISKLYTKTGRKRPNLIANLHIPDTENSIDISYVNATPNIGFFLHKIQNLSFANLYKWQTLLWRYHSIDQENNMVFTIWTNSSNRWDYLVLKAPIESEDQIPDTWTVKLLQITNISDTGEVRWELK